MEDYELLRKDIAYIKASIDEIKRHLETKFVTKTEFEPVKKLTYGATGVILVAFVGALIALVVKS